MNQLQTFWITNGVESNDDVNYIIIKSNKPIKCSHCFEVKKGFVEIGDVDPLGLLTYAICNNCLYRPSLALVNNLFIAISKRKNPVRFNKELNSAKNKELYLELIN